MRRDPGKMQSDHCTEKLQKSEVLLYYRCEEGVAAHNKSFSLSLPKN